MDMNKVLKAVKRDIKKYIKLWLVVILIVTPIFLIIWFSSMREYNKIIEYKQVEGNIVATYNEPYVNAGGKTAYKHITKISYIVDGEEYQDTIEGANNLGVRDIIVYVNPEDYTNCSLESDIQHLKNLPPILFILEFIFVFFMIICNVVYSICLNIKRQRKRKIALEKKLAKEEMEVNQNKYIEKSKGYYRNKRAQSKKNITENNKSDTSIDNEEII